MGPSPGVSVLGEEWDLGRGGCLPGPPALGLDSGKGARGGLGGFSSEHPHFTQDQGLESTTPQTHNLGQAVLDIRGPGSPQMWTLHSLMYPVITVPSWGMATLLQPQGLRPTLDRQGVAFPAVVPRPHVQPGLTCALSSRGSFCPL